MGARSRGFVALALALATLAGCAGQTNRPFGVSATGAILTGEHQCATPSSGKLAWQWRELGAQAWSSGAAVQFSCPAGRRSISHVLHGLKPDTSYQYRLLVDLREPCNLSRPSTCSDVYPLDSGGTANGTAYETFTTQPQCDDVQGPSESLSAFVASNPAGSQADRRVLCLRPGAQSIGQVNGLKAWSTLTPRGKPDGSKEIVVLNGNLGLGSRGATVEDVRVVGCYTQPGCGVNRNKTIDVRASDVSLIHLDVTQRGGRNSDKVQCVLIDGPSQLTNVALRLSKVHSCGSESSGNMEHGLYCSSAQRPLIAGNWFYDNEGFGIQLYPNCDGALAIGNVVAENGASCVTDGSTSTAYVGGFCGFGRENARQPVFPPIHCGSTSGNRSIDMVLYDPLSNQRTSDCWGGQLTPTGTLNADPQFVHQAAYDFRMRNPFARARLGIYAEIPPGPRW